MKKSKKPRSLRNWWEDRQISKALTWIAEGKLECECKKDHLDLLEDPPPDQMVKAEALDEQVELLLFIDTLIEVYKKLHDNTDIDTDGKMNIILSMCDAKMEKFYYPYRDRDED